MFIDPAEMRPYNSVYHPWNWRGWWDFGTGALDDMTPYSPSGIQSSASPIPDKRSGKFDSSPIRQCSSRPKN